MTPAEAYSAAVLQQPPSVIGCRLQPFTLAHALMLNRLGSPFVTGESVPGWGDLLLAAEVCRTPSGSVERRINSRFLAWRMNLLGPARFVLWRDKLEAEMEKLAEYLNGAHQGPRMWSKAGSEKKESGIPYLLNVQVAAMHMLGMTERDTLQTPLKALLWMVYAVAELEGHAQTISPQESAAMEALSCRN